MLLTGHGPPGVGKTVLFLLVATLLRARFLPSYTTRRRRAGEKDFFQGGQYIFVTKKTFLRMLEQGLFLSHVTPEQGQGKYYYGTTIAHFRMAVESREWWLAILVLEVLPTFYSHCGGGTMLSIYLRASSVQFLRANMRKRGESFQEIGRRLQKSSTWDQVVQDLDLPIVEIANSEATTERAVARMIVRIAKHVREGGRVS